MSLSGTGYGRTIFPQVAYGQGNAAWNPASGAPVFQCMERARQEADFALSFCMDILFGKEHSGNRVWFWATTQHSDSTPPEYSYTKVKEETRGRGGDGWLYNDNTLNAASSGVARMFGPPAAKTAQGWCYVLPCTTRETEEYPGVHPRPAGTPQFTLVVENPLTGSDAAYARMLDAGHIAFAARDFYGVLACVPYAFGWEPLKQFRGRPECGNSKKSPKAALYE